MNEESSQDEILNSNPIIFPLTTSNSTLQLSTSVLLNPSPPPSNKSKNITPIPLPALPDSLLEALSREPPPSSSFASSSGTSTSTSSNQPTLTRSTSIMKSGRTGLLGFRKPSLSPSSSSNSSSFNTSNKSSTTINQNQPQPPSPGLQSNFPNSSSHNQNELLSHSSDSLNLDSNQNRRTSSSSLNNHRPNQLLSNSRSNSSSDFSHSSTIQESYDPSTPPTIDNLSNNSGGKKGLWKNAGSAWSRFNNNSSNSRPNSPTPTSSVNSSPNQSRASLVGTRSGSISRDRTDSSITPGRRKEAGRGIDSDLDAMDTEERLSSIRSGSPWSRSRNRKGKGDEYIHDLNASDDELEGDEGEEDLGIGSSNLDLNLSHTLSSTTTTTTTASSRPPESISSSLYTRRRQQEQSSPKVFVPLSSSLSSSAGGGPRTAPLLNSTLTQFHNNNNNPNSASNTSNTPTAVEMLRNRSWSDGNLSHSNSNSIPNLLDSKNPGIGVESSGGGTADFIVAVVGPRNVGKSTIIRRGLKRPVEVPLVIVEDDNQNRVTTCTSVFSIGGQNRTIQVLEIDMALLKYNSEGLIWPPGLPLCEGAMLCYDATDPRALDSLSLLLQAFWTRGSDVPLIVLACKSNPTDENGNQDATDPEKVSEICSVYGAGIVVLDGGILDPNRKMRDSFNWMIRAIMLNRGEIPRTDSSSKSTSFDSSTRGGQSQIDPIPTPSTSVDNIPDTSSNSNNTSSLNSPRTIPKPDIPDGSTRNVRDEGIEYLESRDEVVVDSIPAVSESIQKINLSKNKSPALDLHFSREDMIDKFLFAAVTGNDEQYVTLFLIVYRRFARPFDVLSKLVERFDFVWNRLKTDPLLSRFAQMKLCGVLSTWFQVYPGDFSAPATFVVLETFLKGLLPRGATWVAHYCIELLPLLANVINIEDPEGAWALPDQTTTVVEQNFDAATPTTRRPSLAPSYDSVGSHHLNLEGNQSRLSVPEPPTPTDSTSSNQSSQYRRGSLAETVRSELSETLSVPSPTPGFGRKMSRSMASVNSSSSLLELSNALTELPADSIATQITRLAWESFSEMTPRDLIRHVLAPRNSKNSSSSSHHTESNIMRSINLVNYLADWVSSMILIQPKTKYRAKVLEQCIAIASYLREQENFDSLMGVLAGLNSQPIFRLVDTMEVTHLQMDRDRSRMSLDERERSKIPKKLRSLNKLMATTKSFSAYRLALATSGANMIPYLGVHLQDITVINEIKTDMRDGKVNWSKFSQMGRSAAIVLDCARVAPALEIDKGIEKCILNVPLIDTERQYELSYMYEPRKSETSTLSRRGLRQVVENLTSNMKKTI